ncbi:MAG: tetratricopeptide repeat protein [Chitinophagales bacterium]
MDYVGAKTLLEKAIYSAEENFGASHLTTAGVYSNWGMVYFNLKELKQAVTLLEKAYKVYKNHLGEAHPNTKTIKGNLDYVRSQMQ